MPTTSPGNPTGPGSPQPPPAAPGPVRRTRWPLYGCGAVIALLLIIVATIALTYWWLQRPIRPVVLSPQEKAVVDQKLKIVEGAGASATISNAPSSTTPPRPLSPRETSDQPPERAYLPGSKTLKLTEREVNGLLNSNTDLGKSVRLQFDRDAINAYIAVPIPEDFPIGGGKMFRARGRFRVSIGNGGTPYAILEDVTVFGLSLPKAWLGGIKGENLLGEAISGQRDGKPFLQGIKSLRVEPGALVLEVED